MKKLFALLMALTMTVQLVTPAWADAVEEGPEETTEAVEEVGETTEETEATVEVTDEVTEETAEEVTEETAETEPTEETEEVLPEDEVVEDVAELAAGVVASGTCGENLTWVLTDDGTLTISGSGSMKNYPYSNSAPWNSYRDQITVVILEPGVMSIGNCAFYNCNSLASVTIPESVTSIGGNAFEDCSSLTSVTIPGSVTSINWNTFSGCTALKDIYYGGSQGALKRMLSTSNIPTDCMLHGVTLDNGTCGDGLTWVLSHDGVLTISGSGAMKNYSYRSAWYSNRTKILSVVMEPGVTSIGANAFDDCSSLTRVTIPEGVTSIGGNAFYGCSSLTSVMILEGVMSIGDSAFEGCSGLTSVTIPESVTSIGESAFENCSSLTNITIPESMIDIGYKAFSGCSSLTSVTIPDSVTSIGGGAFRDCSGLTSVTIPEGVMSIGEWAFSYCSSLTSVTIPKSVTSIGESAFETCSSLTSVTILEGVTSIGERNFSDCSSLTSVTIPKSVTSISEHTFEGCNKITDVYYAGTEEDWQKIVIGDDNSALTNATIHYNAEHSHSLTQMPAAQATCTAEGTNGYYICSVCNKVFRDINGQVETTVEAEKIPALGHTIEKIEAVKPSYAAPGNNEYYICARCGKAFKDEQGKIETTVEDETLPTLACIASGECGAEGDNLVWVLAEDGTLTISGHGAMMDYLGKSGAPWYSESMKILSVVIEPGVTSISAYSFYGCSRLNSVSIPEGITTIADGTFEGCGSLKDIHIPESVTSIGEGAFTCCTRLTALRIPRNVKSIDGIISQQCYNLANIFVDDENTEYTSVDGVLFNKSCTTLINYPEGRKDTSYQIPIGVTSIGAAAFFLSNLTDIEISENVTSIGEYAFSGCDKLKSVSIPEGVLSIANGTFINCSNLSNINLPDSVTSIGEDAFTSCNSLTVLRIPKGVKSIDGDIAYGCSSLANILVDDENSEYSSVDGVLFNKNCAAIVRYPEGKKDTAYRIPASVVSIGTNAFSNCSGLTSVEIPNGVTNIGSAAFYDCEGLTSLKIPESVTSIENSAFYWCKNLTSVVIPKSTISIGESAFDDCWGITDVYYGGTEEEWQAIEIGNYNYVLFNTVVRYNAAQVHDLKHIYRKAASCTSAGNQEYWQCLGCGKYFADVNCTQSMDEASITLPALGHIMTKTVAVAPTHTTPGNNAYYTCKTCHKVFRDEKGTTETTPEQEVLPRLPGIADGKSGALTWIISDEGTLTVSGKGRMPDYSGSALAPWYDYKEQIQAVVIEEGVLSIGAYAFFDCENLAEVQLPGSLKQLGKDCFVGCDSLKLLDMSGVPEKAAEKVTDLQGLVKLDASLEKLVGSNAAFHWELETIQGEADARTLAKLTGNKLEVLHSGKFRLVCTEGYTGLTGSAEMEVQSFTVIRPEDRDRMISGETLELSAWAMPFETELLVRWSLEEDSKAYASISDAGVLTVKAVTEPVDITVLASPVNGEETAEKTIRILPKTVGLSILADGEMTGHTLAVDLTEKRTLTLTAQIQTEGAQTAVTWTSEAPDIASVDDAGTVTLLKPGTAVIRGASADGGASAELMLQVFYLDPADTLTLTAGSMELEQGEKTQLVLSGENAIDPENVLFQIAQSQAQLAEVDAQGVVTAKSAAGKVTVVAALKNDPLMRKAELTLQLIQPRDKSPRLDSNKLTLNSNLTAGTTTALVESYNNTIQSVTLYDYDKTTKRYESTPSDSFAAEAEDGTLTVRALSAQKNSTYQLKLVVTCLGGSYDYTLQVKVANSLPKVTVKQIGKFDTFYLDSTAQLTATASGYEVERMELIGADTFRMDEDGNLFYAESYNPGDKIVTKGTLLIYVEGYQVPVEKNVTVATTKTAPKLTLNPSASAVNRALEDPEFRVKVLWKGNALDLTDAEVKADVGFATVEAQGQYLVFRLTGTTGGTAKLSLRLPGWAQAVSLTHKITVDTKLPSVKLGTPTLKLNSLFSAQTARTSVWLTQGNLDISTMDFEAAREEGKCIDLSFDPETDSIEAKFKGIPKAEMPKAGTYSYTYTAYLENGTALPNGTIKVTVAATAPKVKLSAASVKLNRYLAGQEKARVKVTLTGGTGYQVTDFEDLPDYMGYDAESGNLTVVLPNETFTGKTCTLCPIVREEESGQEVPLPTKLTLKIQTLNTNKLTVSLSAKGKLNTVDPDSAIAYTVTKVNNCLGTVENVDLVGQDGDLFQADLDTSGAKPIVLLRLLPGESYATNKTYKVRFQFTVCGKEVLSSVLSVKVTQTALKVTAPKTAVYYLSQSGPLRCSLKANLPLESVTLSARTAKEFQQALGGQENLRLTGNRVEFKLTNPGALTAGKSYSVQLELTPENAAENTKPTTVKLTVKVMK